MNHETDVHIMLDLETFGISPTSKILSIGACTFNPYTGTVDTDPYRQFYCEIDPERSEGTLDISTIMFWMKEAKNGNMPSLTGTTSSNSAWHLFYNYYSRLKCPIGTMREKNVYIWCKGTDFDIPKCPNPPWKYNTVRDSRTIIELFGTPEDKPAEDPNRRKHHALDDAIYQAQWVANILSGMMENLYG